MRVAWLVAWRDLQGRLRDRSAWVTALIAPVTLAGILSLAFSGGEFELDLVAATDTPGDPAAAALLAALTGPPPAAGDSADGGERTAQRDGPGVIRAVDDAGQVRTLVAGQQADAGIVVSATDAGPRMTVVRSEQSPVSGDIAEAVAQGAALRFATGGRELFVEERLQGRSPTSADYYGPAMALFFVFFVMAFGPLSLIAERRDGTLARLAASPIRMRSVLAGKALAVFLLGMASVAAVWLVTSLVFDANWGEPLAVVVLVAATVFAAGGLTTLVASNARNERQADGQISAVVFIGALLGGSFLPLDALPDTLRTLSLFTPNGWAMRGFLELSNRGGLADIGVHVLVLLLIGAVTGAIAGARSARSLAVA